MGIIKRQSLKFTIINFVGTFIGFISLVFIYPLHNEAYGLFQTIFSTSMLMIPLLGLGIFGFIIQYAPEFSRKGSKQHLLSFSLTITAITAIVMGILISLVFYLFQSELSHLFKNWQLIDRYKYTILSLASLLLFCTNLVAVSTSYLRIVVPELILNLMIKIVLPVMVLGIVSSWIALEDFHFYIIGFYALVLLSLLYYILTLDNHAAEPKLNMFDKVEYKGIADYTLFFMLNGIGSTLAVRMDIFMIGSMISAVAVGTYSLVLTISNVIDIPNKAFSQISAPVISRSLSENDMENVKKIYQSSSIYGAAVALFMFILIYHSWGDIIGMMPGEKGGLNVELASQLFLFFGLAKVIEISTGTNSLIIMYSKYYRYHMYALLIMGILNAIFAYFLIGKYGMVGAAMATAFAFLVFNVIKYFFVRAKFGLDLDKLNLLKIAAIFGGIWLLFYIIPLPFNPLINLPLRAIAVGLVTLIMILWIDPGKLFRTEIYKTLESIKSFLPKSIYSLLIKILPK